MNTGWSTQKDKYRNISSWDKLKVNFWAIPKCASTTIKTHLYLLENNTTPDTSTFFVHDEKYVKFINEIEASQNDYINFTVTRDPYERFISIYNDLILSRPQRGIRAGLNPEMSLNDLIEFIDTSNYDILDIHLRPQSYFITKNILCINLQHLQHDWPFNFSSPMFIINKSKNVINKQLSINQKDKIYTLYKPDFIKFNYSK